MHKKSLKRHPKKKCKSLKRRGGGDEETIYISGPVYKFLSEDYKEKQTTETWNEFVVNFLLKKKDKTSFQSDKNKVEKITIYEFTFKLETSYLEYLLYNGNITFNPPSSYYPPSSYFFRPSYSDIKVSKPFFKEIKEVQIKLNQKVDEEKKHFQQKKEKAMNNIVTFFASDGS